jgi:hypothetical protein
MSHDDFVAEVFYTAGDEYPSFAPAAICDISSTLCLNGEPHKGEICAQMATYPDLQMYVMDLALLCGYTNDRNEEVASETQLVCDSWADACTNNVPNMNYLCTTLNEASNSIPDAFWEEGDLAHEMKDVCC